MSGPASPDGSVDLPPACRRIFDLAERDPQRAVRWARRLCARAHTWPAFDRALATYALGYALLRWERLEEAGQRLAEADAFLRNCGRPLLALHVRRALLSLDLLYGGDAHHAAAWADLAAAYAQLGDALSAARARLGQMIQLNVQDQPREALDLAESVRPVLAQLGTPGDHAWLLRISGLARLRCGTLGEAEADLTQAAEQFQALGQLGELAKTWIERSHLYEQRGDLGRTCLELEEAYQLVKQCDLPLRMAICLKNLGWFAAQRGEYDRGIRLSTQAYAELEQLGRRDYMAGCDMNLGAIAYFAGLPDLALAAYQRAERVYAELNRGSMRLACRLNQALALQLQHQTEAALDLLVELRADAQQHDEPWVLANCIHAAARALADCGRAEEALAAFGEAEQHLRRLDNPSAVGECLLGRGWLLLKRGAAAQAEATLREAYPLLLDQPINQWLADYGLGRCAAQRDDLSAARARYDTACRTVARMRRSLANEHASSGLFAQAQQLMVDALSLAWRQRDAASALQLAELQRALALDGSVRAAAAADAEQLATGLDIQHLPWADDAAALDADLTRNLEAYREGRLRSRRSQPLIDDLAVLDLTALRAICARAFPAGWTALVYVPCAELLLTVILHADALEITAAPYDDQLRRLLRLATRPELNSMTYYDEGADPAVPAWPTLRALGERLIPAQVRDRLHPDHRLLIVASGSFHNLPWAALRIGDAWLVERATPHVLPSLIIWQALVGVQPRGRDALLIGIGDIGSRGERLSGVATSLDLVERLWPGEVDRLDGDAARADALLALAASGRMRHYRLIHIAAHGQMEPVSGLLSHLKLADRDLLYDDLSQLSLSGALVVLAACEGAAAEVLPGDEVLSLSWASLAAGARDVIASQWEMYDEVVPAFMGLLYPELIAGYDPPTALARAQRAWLALPRNPPDPDEPFSAPIAWASLCAIGAGTSFELERQ